ncbi:hypothetical protein [Caedibacter taeniospiralis]|jgi:hypothetical protein|uniref:hypothetical protein n=1 Tax=Caedibacter taeniospiralis TaxID=28907 RepID=UPI0037C0A6D9
MKKLLLALGLATASTSAFAATYQIYNQPDANSQVVSQLTDQNQNQYIQFYQQGDWIKVADTATGQVGWVNTAQIKQSQAQEKYQQAVNALALQQQQLDAQRQAFEQKYQQTAQRIQAEMQQLQQQMNAAAQPAAQVAVPTTQKPVNTADANTVQRSFNAVSIQTNKDGKTAMVTKEWLGKDGKMHKETKQIPVSELQKMSMNF